MDINVLSTITKIFRTKVTDVQCQKFKGCVRGICKFSYPTNPLGGRMLGVLKIDRAPEPGFGHGQGLLFSISSCTTDTLNLLVSFRYCLKTTPTYFTQPSKCFQLFFCN